MEVVTSNNDNIGAGVLETVFKAWKKKTGTSQDQRKARDHPDPSTAKSAWIF